MAFNQSPNSAPVPSFSPDPIVAPSQPQILSERRGIRSCLLALFAVAGCAPNEPVIHWAEVGDPYTDDGSPPDASDVFAIGLELNHAWDMPCESCSDKMPPLGVIETEDGSVYPAKAYGVPVRDEFDGVAGPGRRIASYADDHGTEGLDPDGGEVRFSLYPGNHYDWVLERYPDHQVPTPETDEQLRAFVSEQDPLWSASFDCPAPPDVAFEECSRI